MVANFRSYILAISSKFLRSTLLKKKKKCPQSCYQHKEKQAEPKWYAIQLPTREKWFCNCEKPSEGVQYNMVGEFYRTVLSYGLGLCIAKWVELWRDLVLKCSDPLTVPKKAVGLREMVKKPTPGHRAASYWVMTRNTIAGLFSFYRTVFGSSP